MKNQPYWRVNEHIYAKTLRVIDADGKALGVLTKEEALKKSKEAGLDLVEIAPGANPPVSKIINFGKFKYREEKKLRGELKKQKAAELKEIRFSPFIAENDYRIRFSRVKEFIDDKNKVRLAVVFKRPQLNSKRFGYLLLARIVKELGDGVGIDMQPKFLGKSLLMIISPVTKKKKIEPKEEQNAETKN